MPGVCEMVVLLMDDKSEEPVEKNGLFFWLLKHLTQLVQDFNSKIKALNYTNNVVSLNGGLAGQTWRKSPISPSSFQSNEYRWGIMASALFITRPCWRALSNVSVRGRVVRKWIQNSGAFWRKATQSVEIFG